MEDGTLLSEIWETYAQLARRRSDKHATQKRHAILDKFLRLHLMLTAGPHGVPRFGGIMNVSNQLSQELMADILTVSNSSKDESDASSLQQYLLSGRGWKLLHVIHAVGVKSLSNSRDVCNLLLSLLPWCTQFSPGEPHTHSQVFTDKLKAREPIQECFAHVQKMSKLKTYGCQQEKSTHLDHPSHFSPEVIERRKRKLTKLSSAAGQSKGLTESEDEEPREEKVRHPRHKKPARLVLYTAHLQQEEDDSGSDHDLMAAFPDFHQVQNDISSAELTLVIFDLLHDLCILDLTHAAPGKVLSPAMLQHLLHFYTSISQPEPGSELVWTSDTRHSLRAKLLRLIMFVCGVIATQQTGVKVLIGHNVVSVLMSPIKGFIEEEGSVKHDLGFVQDVICSLILLFEVVFENLPFNPSFINSALGLLECFRFTDGYQFIKKLALLTTEDRTDVDGLVDDPVKHLSSLIGTLKLVKINYIHAVKCLKRRHRHCEYDMYLSHHHNVLGYPSGMDLEQYEASMDRHRHWSTNPSKCQIASLSSLLLEILAETKSPKLQIQILATLRHPGICCCMQPKTIIEAFSPLIPHFTPSIKSCCLECLNDILLDQFIGSEDPIEKKLPERNICKLCTFEGSQSNPTSPTTPKPMKMIDSGFSSSEMDAKKQWSLQRWRPLQVFRQYVLSPDESLALITAKHLIVLAIRGNSDLKQELFFKIYQYVIHSHLEDSLDTTSLTSSSDEQLAISGKVPSSIMLYCVSALPYVLQVDKVMNAFVEKEGLSRLNNLLEDANLRAPVMGMFEALIMIDEQKVREMKNTNAAEALKFASEYIRGTVMQTFIDMLAKKTCVITAAFQQIQIHKQSEKSSEPADSGFSSDGQSSSSQSFEKGHEGILTNLPLLLDMWQTCAKLCMNSPTFRSFYRNSPCLYIVQDTLLLAIELLGDMGSDMCNPQHDGPAHARSFSCHLRKLAFIESVMIVCFACHTVAPKQKKGAEEVHWKQLRDSLQLCVKLEPTKLKAVFEMLLNAGLPQLPSILEYSYSQIIAVLNLKDGEMVDEDEVRELLHFGGSEEEDALCTEHGYEADTEASLLSDWKKNLQCGQDNHLKREDTTCFPAVFRLFVELAISCYKSTESVGSGGMVVSAMLRLLHTLRSSPPAVLAVCSQGVLEVVIDGFKTVLVQSTTDQHELDLREILLSLIQLLAQREISAGELRLYLRLFLEQGHPVKSLVSTLMSVVENCQVEPSYTITFPVLTNTPQPAEHTRGVADAPDQQHVWSARAMQCDLKDSILWPPVESGFSVALWMKVADVTDDPMMHLPKLKNLSSSLVFNSVNFNGDPRCDGSGRSQCRSVCECLHIFSVGNMDKMFEVWVDVRSRAFIIRVTSSVGETEVLKEMSSDGVITPGMWHHVVVSYEEKLNGSTLVGNTNLLVNGVMSRKIVLDYPANFSRKAVSSQPMFLLGQVMSEVEDLGHWHLGNVMLFKGVERSREWWFHHYTLGPNLVSVGKCDCAELSSLYTPYLTKSVLCQTDLSLDVLVGSATPPDAERARAAVVLTYSALTPTVVNYYSTSSLQELLSNLGLVSPTASQDPLLFQYPATLTPEVFGRIQNKEHNTLEKAVEQIGGVQAFLFMVAKIYEGCEEDGSSVRSREEVEQLQSKGLRLLLTLIHHLPHLATDFNNIHGYTMLQKVLLTSRSVIGYEILKALLDCCTSESVFRPDASTPRPVLRQGTEAVVRDVAIIQQLLLSWRIWEKAEEGVVELLFQALETLVRPDHPHRDVNVKQFRSGGIMNKIFYIYLERIQEGLPSLSRGVGQAVSSIVQGMLGNPPDFLMLVAVTDFLLLVHPAASAFIVHSTNSHYLKCWWALSSATSTPMNKVIVRSESTRRTTPQFSESHSEDTATKTDGDVKPSDVQEEGIKTSVEDKPKQESFDSESVSFPPVEESSSIGLTPGFTHSASTDDTQDPQTQHSLTLKHSDTDISEVSEGKDEQNTTIGADVSEPKETGSTVCLKLQVDAAVEPVESYSSNSDDSARTNGYEGSADSEHPELTIACQRSGSHGNEGSEVSDNSPQTSSLLSAAEEDKHEIDESFVEFDEDEQEAGERDVGLVTLCANLLNYLSVVLMNLPEKSLDTVYNKVLNPGSLIVLAQNNSPQIRAAVIRLIGMYTARAPQLHLESFLKMDAFSLLANQIHQYPARQDHIEAAVTILLDQAFTFEESLLEEEVDELSPVQQSSIVLLLSLIEQTAHERALCHNTLCLLDQLLQRCVVLSSILLEGGLMDVLTNLTAVVQRQEKQVTDVVSSSNDDLLLLDIQKILCTLAVREFSWSGVIHYQQIEEMFNLLKGLENKEMNFEDGKKRCENTRALQYAMVVRIIEYVEKRSEEISQQSLNWFTMSTGSVSSTGSYGAFSDSSQFHSLFPSPDTFPPGSFQAQLDLDKGRQCTRRTPSTLSKSSDPVTDQPYDDMSEHTETSETFMDSYELINASKSRDIPHRKTNPVNQSKIASFFGKRKKLIFSIVSQSELLDRFKKFLVLAVDLIVLLEREEVCKKAGERIQMFFSKSTSLEDNYLTKLFNITYRSLEFTLDKNSANRRSRNVIMWGAKDVVRQQFGRLMLCMLSTKMDFNMRLYALSFIMGEMRGRDVVKMLISSSQLGQELSFYLYNLLTMWRDWLVGTQREQGCLLLNVLRQSGFNAFMTEKKLTQSQLESLEEEKRLIDSRLSNAQQIWKQKKQTVIDRLLHRHERQMKTVSEQAMSVTQSVTQLQNVQRKKLVDHIKKSMTEQIHLKKSWQELVQKLTHERAVWYHPSSYPQSWQLDPTEGPGRIRKRLQRCHLGIDKKYLSDGYKQKIDVEEVSPPLIYLFEDDNLMSDSAALLYRLLTNEKIQHTCRCTAVSPASENKGELLVGEMCIFFVADEAITDANYTQALLGNREQLSMTWRHEDIKELHKRWFQLHDLGLEIFLTNGRTFLLAFQSSRERDELYQHLEQAVELPNLLPSENLAAVQKLWLEGTITNYDYLTYLNKMSGRSFNDLMQYPVFPFILRDYDSDELNLDHPQTYRDLSKPIAVQFKEREGKYKENYEFLSQQYEMMAGVEDSIRISPYHYGSHYSNSGTVLHYLVRLPPFTKMFLSYQDRSFDIPDRTFHSMATSWRLSSFDSTSDVKELIPEFFYLPEFMKNGEGYNFGKRQNGMLVWDVTLPPWARADPRLFVLIHRQALESAYVTQHIHQWIDLVFGFKQQGEQSIRAINVFHPATYFGMDVSKIADPLKRQAVLTMIKTYGQTPKQLFRTPHPPVSAGTGGGLSHLLGYEQEVKPNSYVRRPISNIIGLKWGQFVGSPEGGTPVPVWRETYTAVITSLVSLPTNFVFGLGADSCALVLYAKDRADLVVNSTDVMWAGIVSWGHPDRIMRVHNQFNLPLVNFLPEDPADQILCCASVPDCRLLFTAGSAGVITVYNIAHNRAKSSNLQVYSSKSALYGHTGAINMMCVCTAYSVLVSASDDGTCIIWDLNRLSYVCSISSHNSSVKTVAVSDTLGDIVSISPRALGSFLQLHTINGQFVASRKCDEFTINCVTFSRAPEGRAINLIAGGLSNGAIRLWSSWDLTVLRDLSYELSIARPVVSICFSHDSQRLYASAQDGSVTIWEKPSPNNKPKPDNFVPFVDKRGTQI